MLAPVQLGAAAALPALKPKAATAAPATRAVRATRAVFLPLRLNIDPPWIVLPTGSFCRTDVSILSGRGPLGVNLRGKQREGIATKTLQRVFFSSVHITVTRYQPVYMVAPLNGDRLASPVGRRPSPCRTPVSHPAVAVAPVPGRRPNASARRWRRSDASSRATVSPPSCSPPRSGC